APGAARTVPRQPGTPGAARDDPGGEVQVQPGLRTGTAPTRPRAARFAGGLRGEWGHLRPRLVWPARGDGGGAGAFPIQPGENQSMLKQEKIWFLLLPVVLGRVSLGVGRLFRLRFDSG